jgi:ABC-2 type transport system ATP-binding protein
MFELYPRGQTMSTSIEATGLRKHYPPDVQALDGLDLAVEEGTIFALLGPNGAGKSTTVRILTTLTTPDEGAAVVAGHDVLAAPDRVRRSIGVVGQKHGFDPEGTGRENLVLQGAFYDLTGRTLTGRVDELLDRFELTNAADRRAKTYSGGMQRRLDIAMGLLHHPAVLFLDEPTTGLDPEARVDMWAEIDRLARDEKMTILLTTHYLDEADELASRVAIVDRGRIVASGTPDDLKEALEGDSLHFELAEPSDGAVAEVLRAVEGLTEVTVDGRFVRARARHGATAMPPALAALEAAGYAVTSVTMSRPSLDEVYLRHAGRSFRDAEEAS